MVFEEQFPSLKKLDEEEMELSSVVKSDLIKYCLDKQKVKEAIKKLYPLVVTQKLNHESINDLRGTLSYAIALDDIKKELGIDK